MVNKIFELQKQKIFLKFKFNEYFLRYIFEQGNETKTQIKKTQIKKTQIKKHKGFVRGPITSLFPYWGS